MPRKPISFELDFMIKDIFPRFTVKQFDDVSFNIKPLNQGLDYDTTGMIGKIFVGVNDDMFMQTTGITVSSNNINVLLDKNMLQKNGRAYAEIELTDEVGTITSSSFIFDIDPKIGEGGMIPGEYEGFVEKYERLISEFKNQINSSINNSNDLIDKTIKNCNTSVDNKLNTVNDRFNAKVSEVDSKLNSVDSLINAKVSDFEKRFNTLTSSKQQDAEIIDARDEEESLKARLDRDIEKINNLEETVTSEVVSESDFITVENTNSGYFSDIKLEGKTLILNADNEVVEAGTEGVTLKSVGQDVDEISVLSTKENLFDVKSVIEKYPDKITPFGNGLRAIPGLYDLTHLIPDVNKQYTISWHGELVTQSESGAYIMFAFVYTDGTSQYALGTGDMIVSSTKGKTIKEFIITYSKTCTMNLTNISLVQGDTPKPYQPHKQDKKRILYYNDEAQAWEKPILRQWDSIEKHSDGKYYYHKRSGEVVLDENIDSLENVQYRLNSNFTNTLGHVNVTTFSVAISDYLISVSKGTIISDRFKTDIDRSYDGAGIYNLDTYCGATTIGVKINNNELSSYDVNGFKKYLETKPIVLVYKLEQEKVYECTNLDLITYTDETNFMVKSGVLNPKVTLKVKKGIGNVVTMMQNKISLLEDLVNKLIQK